MSTPASAKRLARAYWAACDMADKDALRAVMADDMMWEGPWPAKEARSAEALVDLWAGPMRAAFPDMHRQFHILTAGVSDARTDGGADGALWVAGCGYLVGPAVAECLGLPATDRVLRLRWGEFLRIEDDRIAEVQLIVDLVDWCEQIGRPVLPPSRGVPGVWPAATAFDAVLLGDEDPGETAETLDLGRDLIFGGLNVFDRGDLQSMDMARFFHPNLKWYGPGGIGACLSFAEFEDLHQRPWLDAFPDRKVENLRALFAEGRVLSASGTAGVVATHSGDYLGTPPSGATLEVSGIDFWLRTDAQFTENWVFVDMVKLFGQMGVDLLDRARHAP